MVFVNLKKDGIFKMADKTYGPENLTIEQLHSNPAAARAAMHLHYFTGKPCKWGHVVPRRTKGWACVECNRIYHNNFYATHKKPRRNITKEERNARIRARYKANREKYLLKDKKYREANPDQIKATRQRYWEKNKEKITQRKKEWNKGNRERVNAIARASYLRNKEKILKRAKEKRRKNKEKKKELKKLLLIQLLVQGYEEKNQH